MEEMVREPWKVRKMLGGRWRLDRQEQSKDER